MPLPPQIPPRPVSRLRQGFYGAGRPAQPAFVSPPLPDIWRCVEATWRQPLKTKATVATCAGIRLRRSEGVPVGSSILQEWTDGGRKRPGGER